MFCNDEIYRTDKIDWESETDSPGKIFETEEYMKHFYKKQKRKKRFQQKERYKKHLKLLYENASGFPWGVRYCDARYVRGKGYVPLPKPYYQRCYRSNHAEGNSGWYKRYANKAVRRYPGYIAKGGEYKKVFDYWWSIT